MTNFPPKKEVFEVAPRSQTEFQFESTPTPGPTTLTTPLNCNSREDTVISPASYCNYYQNGSRNRTGCPIKKSKISPLPEKDHEFSHKNLFNEKLIRKLFVEN